MTEPVTPEVVEVVQHLPAPVQDSRVSPTAGYDHIINNVRMVRHKLSEVAIGAPWDQIVRAAARDVTLSYSESSICRPETASHGIFGEKIRPSELSYESQLVYRRLVSLVERVKEVSAKEIPGFEFAPFPGLFKLCEPAILWDAANDLLMADRIIEDNCYHVYNARFSRLRRESSPQSREAVRQLRARVVYLIDALQSIYDAAFGVHVALRLQETNTAHQKMIDMIAWLQNYAATLRPVDHALSPPETPKPHWWQKF